MTKSAKGTALVTGASSGIGAIYADRLARRGYDLILVARNRERLDGLAKRLAAETGRSIEIVAADLSKRGDVSRIEAILRDNAGISVLVNNAGVGATAPLSAHRSDAYLPPLPPVLLSALGLGPAALRAALEPPASAADDGEPPAPPGVASGGTVRPLRMPSPSAMSSVSGAARVCARGAQSATSSTAGLAAPLLSGSCAPLSDHV